ncbi:MAG: DNA-formamidopyrimidine glycosylase [Candidatus Harrisonbacteria bacterium]|nr:DNA-formamidopyrimidine glycosylase [Candidatus Harrisonbacteria bacterium]
MPELPEVETTVRDLKRILIGRKITSVWFDVPKFKSIAKTKGLKIEGITRQGKNILFSLSGGHVLLVHMKMTGHLLLGKWRIGKKGVEPISPAVIKERVNSYIHFILSFDKGPMLGFSDLRKFGNVKFGKADSVAAGKDLTSLGPDVLIVDSKVFSDRIRARKKKIYQILLDQTVISGPGNIYVNESLFLSGIHPETVSSQISPALLKRLHSKLAEILTVGVNLGGTSLDDYRRPNGERGFFGNKIQIYGREKLPCMVCGTIIMRKKIGARSAFFCLKCQKPKR